MSGLSVCVYSHIMAGFFRISELLRIRKSNIVTEDLYHKIFIEVSKTDKYRVPGFILLRLVIFLALIHTLLST